METQEFGPGVGNSGLSFTLESLHLKIVSDPWRTK
jgi:hypothetical protein